MDNIFRLEMTGQRVATTMRSIEPEHLDVEVAPGEWTPRMVVHHLADTEVMNAVRLRRILIEDDPQLPNFSETGLAEAMHYDREPIVSIELFEAIHQSNIDVLRALDPEQWERPGRLEGVDGTFGVNEWIERRIGHQENHERQILTALGR